EVEAFDAAFARLSEVRHCVGVANGTDALEIVLRAAGIGQGDEVIVPVNSFIATALAVARAGAVPALVDCDRDHHLIDVAEVRKKIGRRTRAIVAVHLYGQMAPMEELAELASGCGLVLVEDAAQAHGARRHGRTPGTFGLAAGTSFYPAKNLGAYGDAGAVLTDRDTIDRRARALRNYGSEAKYVHPETGFNSRLDPFRSTPASRRPSRSAWPRCCARPSPDLSSWLAIRRSSSTRRPSARVTGWARARGSGLLPTSCRRPPSARTATCATTPSSRAARSSATGSS